MNKIKIIAVINIFLLSFIAHFIYDFCPSIFISFFFPVNESIWEHMKILFTSTLVYGLFDYILLKVNNVKFNNYSFSLFFTSFIAIPIFLMIYMPIYYLFGEVLIVTLIIMLITYIICQFISYKILSSKQYLYLNYISIPLIILTYIVFIIFTYNPPKMPLFYDTLNKYYGIKRTY